MSAREARLKRTAAREQEPREEQVQEFDLLDFCEPVFAELCSLSQACRSSGRGGGSRPAVPRFEAARSDWRRIFADLDKAAVAAPELRGSYREVKPALIHFVDEMMIRLPWDFANEWRRSLLALDLLPAPAASPSILPGARPVAPAGNNVIGGDHFFQLIDSDLRRAGDSVEARQRLAVYHVCLGFGFRGRFFNDPAGLAEESQKIRDAIPELIHADSSEPIFGDSHKPNTKVIYFKPSRWVSYAVIGLLILCVSMLAGCNFIYYGLNKELLQQLGQIIKGK